MNKFHPKKEVLILDKATGAKRMSVPMPVQGSRLQDVPGEQHVPTTTEATPVPAAVPMAWGGAGLPQAKSQAEASLSTSSASAQEVAALEGSPYHSDLVTRDESLGKHEAVVDGKGAPSGKAKVEIETLEQFIAHVFSRKGRGVKLTSKAARLIAQSPALDESAMKKLLALAESDALLAVPRQLLLVSREVEGLPRLRESINEFVLTAVRWRPVFADEGVQAVLRNLPEAPPPEVALKRLAGYTPPSTGAKDDLKPAEVQALRMNAINLLTTWLAIHRSLRLDDLAKLLFQSVWEPAARELVNDNARLRALTEIEQSAGVGLACDRFRQNVIEANASCDQAYREVATLREMITVLQTRLEQAEIERSALAIELHSLKESSAKELAETRRQHEVERTHLRHDHEQLRGRMVRRLSDSVEMLEVGLSALRNKTPRTEVMAERAEHVIDALRSEETNLREE